MDKHFQAFFFFLYLYPGKKIMSDPQRCLNIIYCYNLDLLWVLLSLLGKQWSSFPSGTIISEAESLARLRMKLMVQATHFS